MFASVSDIPKFVEESVVDMRITGINLIEENESEVEKLVDLNFGQTSLVLVSSRRFTYKFRNYLKDDMVIATEFPVLTKKYLNNLNLNLKIVKLRGSTELLK